MVSRFKKAEPVSIFWLILLSITVHLRFFSIPPVFSFDSTFVLLNRLTHGWNALPSLLISFLYHLIVILQAVRMNYTANTFQLTNNNTSLPGMCYILFTGLLPEWGNITGALLANSFFLGIMPSLKNIHEKDKPEKTIFNIGFFVSAGIVLYPPLLPLSLALLVALAIFSTFRLNRLLAYLLGLLTPVYILGGILYLKGEWPSLVHFLPQIKLYIPHIQSDCQWIAAVAVLILHFLLGAFFGERNSTLIPYFSRKLWTVIFLLFFVFIADMFIFNGAAASGLLLTVLPVAYIGGLFYNYSTSGFMKGLLFWLTVAVGYYNAFEAAWKLLLGKSPF